MPKTIQLRTECILTLFFKSSRLPRFSNYIWRYNVFNYYTDIFKLIKLDHSFINYKQNINFSLQG